MNALELLVDALARTPPKRSDAVDRPQAAVAILLVADPDRVLLIRRAERSGDPWSGHIALPGGRYQQGDADLLATAMRETDEEVGVTLERSWCQAELDDLAPRTAVLPPIMVRPFLFILPEAFPPVPTAEVFESSWVPLADLAREGVFGSRMLQIRGESRLVEGYDLAAGFLWGMTERILTPVVTRWKELAPHSR